MPRARKTPFKREPRADLEDLRDDSVAVFLNSGYTQQDVHARGGPTPATISRWLYKETMFPQLATVRSLLLACGYDFRVLPVQVAMTVPEGVVTNRQIARLRPTTQQELPPRKRRRSTRRRA